MPGTVLVARPLWPVLESVAEGLASRGYIVERSDSWDPLLAAGPGSDLAAVFLGEYGDVAAEEEILRRFRRGGNGEGVPVFLIGGGNALRWEHRLRKAGADQVLPADLPAPEILERAKPLHSLGDMYREARTANRELRERSLTDELTGLPNRRRFMDELDRGVEMARRIGRPLSCIVSDIDGIRDLNEMYGFPVGDSVIRQFGGILDGEKRRCDTVARLDGDGFVWLLVGAGAPQAARAALRAHRKVSERVFEGAHPPVRVTATWGVSSISPETPETGRSLLENADRALFWGKESGKNRIRCCPPERMSADDQEHTCLPGPLSVQEGGSGRESG